MRILSIGRSEILRWDVKSHTVSAWDPSVVPLLRRLGDLATRRIEPAETSVPLGSINFGGRISVRSAARQTKGKTYVASPGNIVFSRIDVRNGAIGVLGPEQPEMAFSGEYPIYDLSDPGVVRPDYMRLLCRTSVFRSQINARVIGHSGRKRLPAEEFEELLVPVPDLAEQDALLQELAQRSQDADALRSEALPLLSRAGKELLERLGVQVPEFDTIRQPFAVPRSLVHGWSVRKGMAARQGAVQEISSDRPLHALGENGLSEVAYGVTKNPKNRPGEHARPYLRVANVQDGFLDLTLMKEINVLPEAAQQYELKAGDLLLCEGNSRELVGRPAMWGAEIPGCVHQNHVLRVRVNRDRLLPEFVLAYMHGPAGRWYFDSCAKQTTNLATINSTDVRSLPIPVPSMPEQIALAAFVSKARTEANELRQRAEALDVTNAQWLAARLGSTGVATTASEDDEGSEEAA